MATPQFAEVIYETGDKSVCQVDNLDEFMSGLTEAHKRATAGLAGDGGSVSRREGGHPAMRVKKVLLYDKHPADYNDDMTMSSDVLRKELDEYFKDKTGVVNLHDVAAFLRELANPMVSGDDLGPHDSMFKMKENTELTSGWEGA